MLTLARALGGRPRLLLADELSLGPASLVVDRLLQGAAAELKALLQEIESIYLSAGGPPEAAEDIDE
jgi:ABC-type branched-subunit amino acid transport system ATPase component